MASFRTQLETGFFDKYNTTLVAFPIQDESGKFKFRNSELIVRYIYATEKQGHPRDEQEGTESPAVQIITRIFTEKNEDGMTYQDAFNDNYSAKEAEEVLLKWLKEFGYHHDERDAIQEFAKSDEIGHIIEKNNQIVVEDIHAKGIPTMIYDNKKHSGKYEE